MSRVNFGVTEDFGDVFCIIKLPMAHHNEYNLFGGEFMESVWVKDAPRASL